MNDLVARVQKKRIELELSIREAAKLIDIPFQTLARLEKGTASPNKATARAMHRWVFDISGEPLPESKAKAPRWSAVMESRIAAVEEKVGIRR